MILNVTPGINLNAVSGPISKSQINQLGQPVVTLSPGSVVTADTNFSSLKIEDATFPLIELRTTSGPTDKKFVRWTQDASGLVKVARVNDAYTFETALIYWDVSNNATLGAGTLTVNGGISGVQGTLKGAADNSAWSIVAGSSAPGVSTSGAWISLYGGTSAVNPGALVFGSNNAATGAVTPGGNFGFGTLSPTSRLTVAGDIRLLNNATLLVFTDQSGSTPYFGCGATGLLGLTGTDAAGAQRNVFQCAMRSDTSPLQVNVPLRVGPDGANISRIRSVLFTESSSRVIPSGSTIATDVSLVGVQFDSDLTVTPIYELSDKRVIVRARPNGSNIVRVEWTNPTASAITIDSNSYRVLETRISI